MEQNFLQKRLSGSTKAGNFLTNSEISAFPEAFASYLVPRLCFTFQQNCNWSDRYKQTITKHFVCSL